MRKEKAVWWNLTGIDQFGEPQYADPVEISCRWEDVLQKAINAQGDEFTSSSSVYVDREMKPDDMLWRGTLEDLPEDMADSPTADPPLGVDPARRIQGWSNIPKLSYKESLLTAYL